MRPGLRDSRSTTTIFRAAQLCQHRFRRSRTVVVDRHRLVLIVLGVFLFEWRSALISESRGINSTLSLISAMPGPASRGTTLNTMILAGLVIALGRWWTDAIVDMENITRRLRICREQGVKRSTASVVLEASIESGAVVYASFIEVFALLPVFSWVASRARSSGPWPTPMPWRCWSPWRWPLWSPRAQPHPPAQSQAGARESPLVRVLKRGYGRALGRIIRRPRYVYAVLAIIVAGGVAALPFMGESLFPTFKERDILIHFVTTPGTSVAEEDRIMIRLSNELEAIPGVRNFGAHIGQGVSGDEIAGVNMARPGSASIPGGLRRDHLQGTERRRRLPGSLPRRGDVLNERIEEPSPGRATLWWCASTARIWTPFGRRLRKCRRSWRCERRASRRTQPI